MIIIGLVGKKRSGKDTFGQILEWNSPIINRVIRVAFADALKREVALAVTVVDGIIGNKRSAITPKFIDEHKEMFRLILQGWGTELRRELYNRNYWTAQLQRRIGELHPDSVVYIPDVRFRNEADLVKELGGINVSIVRPNYHIDGDTHTSEVELETISCDYQVINSGTLEDYSTLVMECFNKIKTK